RGRIVAVDVRHPAAAAWKEVVPQAPDVIEGSQIVHSTFVVRYLHDAYSQLRLFALDGKPAGDVGLPTLGSIVQVTGEPRDTEMFYAFTSFLYPTTIFRHDFTTGTSTVFKAPDIAFDPAKYETVQVFYPSKDGRRVADRCRAESAARIVRRRPAGRRRDGHAALPQVHDRLGVGDRIRLGRQRRAVPVSAAVLADPQYEAGDALSRDLDHDRRSRRPRGAGALVQIRSDAP